VPSTRLVPDAGRQTIELQPPALVLGTLFIPGDTFEWDTRG
jgi:hypothetical protein